MRLRIELTSRLGLRACQCLVVLALTLFGPGSTAQAPTAENSTKVVNGAGDVTFDLLSKASLENSHQVERVRRFMDERGSLVQVRERLTVQADGTPQSPFRLDFLGVLGSESDPFATAKWQDLYRTNAGLLQGHGTFRVHDPAIAATNYRIFDFGVSSRAGREVRRVVVFPYSLDKGIWLIDVDTATGICLYSAEYDVSLRLLNELEATSFSLASVQTKGQAQSPSPTARSARPSWSWQPRMTVMQFDGADEAVATLSSSTGIVTSPAIVSLIPDYHRNLVQVTEDPVNGDKTLVLGYTDGIDEFFILQSSGAINPFAIGWSGKVDSKTHAIGCYDDPAMRFYVFFESGVLFQVVGRGSLTRLKSVSLRLCQQAVTGV